MQNEIHIPKSLYGLDEATLVAILGLQKAFSGKQIFNWLVKGVTSFDQMTNLSKAERERLKALMGSPCSSVVHTQHTDSSGATKLGIKLHDGSIIETVLL
ncbi:MAG: 23S rRNA (adenine(2503)-C(2))-methyltransferase RlmN, partial [Spirochaetia bacterium]|nr:23S rRNA (adenine(2503)-C(2))-methyltransferase RlmN [Spirochaetia bacterium]